MVGNTVWADIAESVSTVLHTAIHCGPSEKLQNLCPIFFGRRSSCDLHSLSGASRNPNAMSLHSIFSPYHLHFPRRVAFLAASLFSLEFLENHQKCLISIDFQCGPTEKLQNLCAIFFPPSEQLRPSFLVWGLEEPKRDVTTFDFFALPPSFSRRVAFLAASLFTPNSKSRKSKWTPFARNP